MNDTLQAPADAPPPNKRKLGIALALVLAIVVVVGLWLAWRSPADQIQGMADADTVNEIQAQLERGVPFRVAYEAGRQYPRFIRWGYCTPGSAAIASWPRASTGEPSAPPKAPRRGSSTITAG